MNEKSGKEMAESTADEKLREILIPMCGDGCHTDKPCDKCHYLKMKVKEIKSHYYAKSEVERIISNLTTNNNFNQGTTYFDVLEDLKTELQKLGER